MALVSMDLLKYLSRDIPPAQLVLFRTAGDEYVIRVRYRDVHLDYKLNMSPIDSTAIDLINFDHVHGCLVAMARLVTPPDANLDPNWNQNPSPVLGFLDEHEKFKYEW